MGDVKGASADVYFIASRLEAIATRLEAIATRLEDCVGWRPSLQVGGLSGLSNNWCDLFELQDWFTAEACRGGPVPCKK